MTELTTTMNQHVVKQILGLDNNHRALIINTPGGNSIVTRYVINRTSVKNVIKTLQDKIQLSFGHCEQYEPMKNVMLIYKNNYLKNMNKSLSYYGINELVENVELIHANKKMNYYNPDELDIVRNNMRIRLKNTKNAEIYIKTLTGKTITVTVPEDINGLELMTIVQDKEGIPVGHARILHKSFEVSETSTLLDSHYKNLEKISNSKFKHNYPRDKIKISKILDGVSIINEQTCHLLVRLRGGMYSESSGKNGNYQSLENVLDKVYDIEI
jgi:hypothetical protein